MAIGTVAWAIGAIALAVTAAADGVFANPWFWTCLVGTASGLIGMRYLTVRWQRIQRADQSD